MDSSESIFRNILTLLQGATFIFLLIEAALVMLFDEVIKIYALYFFIAISIVFFILSLLEILCVEFCLDWVVFSGGLYFLLFLVFVSEFMVYSLPLLFLLS